VKILRQDGKTPFDIFLSKDYGVNCKDVVLFGQAACWTYIVINRCRAVRGAGKTNRENLIQSHVPKYSKPVCHNMTAENFFCKVF
jgi:hypothetical protein